MATRVVAVVRASGVVVLQKKNAKKMHLLKLADMPTCLLIRHMRKLADVNVVVIVLLVLATNFKS
jgi:hypothetical protein